MNRRLTVIIEREGTAYISLCPELDVASQGDNVEEARSNLQEALTLLLEAALPEEMGRRIEREVYVTGIEVGVGQLEKVGRPGNPPDIPDK